VYEEWLTAQSPWPGPAPGGAIMLYTSGTTGWPKGIERAPATPEAGARMACLFPMVFGLEPRMSTLVMIMSRFDPEVSRTVEARRIQHTQLVPTMFVRLLRLPAAVRARCDLSSLRGVVHVAAPWPVHVKHRMIDWWGPIVREYYASSETGALTVCDSAEWLAHSRTVGRPVDDVEIRILDESGGLLPPGQTGKPDVWRRQTFLLRCDP
jgi:long-chain acyl-CoA synthetase